jgi:hypothetical protein
MFYRPITAILTLAMGASIGLVGCTTQASATNDEEDVQDLTQSPKALYAGTWTLVSGQNGKLFDRLVLDSDAKTFDAETRAYECDPTAPACTRAVTEHAHGVYLATSGHIFLQHPTGTEVVEPALRNTAGGRVLTLTSSYKKGWSNTLFSPTREYAWTPDATTLLLESSGGGPFAPKGPAGSECTVGNARFLWNVPFSTLEYSECRQSAPDAPFLIRAGKRKVGLTTTKNLRNVANTMVISEGTRCMRDAGMRSIAIDAPSRTTRYVDEVFKCDNSTSAQYVSRTQPMLDALSAAANE